jgi:hypothetical protein
MKGSARPGFGLLCLILPARIDLGRWQRVTRTAMVETLSAKSLATLEPARRDESTIQSDGGAFSFELPPSSASKVTFLTQ